LHAKTIAFLLALALAVCFAAADPPTPHSVAGFIFTSAGINQAPLGTTYEINESVSKAYVKGQTSIPVPGMTGRYFAVISGVNGDLTIVKAWNSTHYGNISISLLDALDNVNIFLNRTRYAETNVTIAQPSNNSLKDTYFFFNLTSNTTVISANGTGCNATINFSDPSAFLLGAGETLLHQLGEINVSITNSSTWNISGIKAGTYNISVSSICTNQTTLEHKDSAWINVSINDVTPPIVRLMYPGNNTISHTTSIGFKFNVSEQANLANCSLIINNQLNVTNTTLVQKDAEQTLQSAMDSGEYNWSVNCTDQFGNTGSSFTYNLTVNASGPIISGVYATSPIILQSATTANAECNATIVLSDISRGITLLNATLYDPLQASYLSADDNNNHYTNTTCEQTGKSGVLENYSCTFALWYYANNASWACTISAMDTDQASSTESIGTYVNELVSFGVNSSVLEYGEVAVDDTSGITNITMYNLGNKDLNVSLLGFAVNEDDNLAMVCGQNTNIPIQFERYSISSLSSYDGMISLTGDSAMVGNFTLYQRTEEILHSNDVNSTYWRIRVPAPAVSNCSGVISLAASKA
jgi:hypothetical protein